MPSAIVRRAPSSFPSRAPGKTGTPARSMRSRASVFEPMAAMACGEGPIQVSPASMTDCANALFSDRKP
jgi:hypothetical protein